MRTTVLNVVAAAVLAASLAACSGGDDDGEEVSAEQVIEAFETVTGERLVARKFDHPLIETGWTNLDLADERARGKFGTFNLVVYDDLEEARRRSLPPEDVLEIRWQYHPPEEFRATPLWSASLSYRNVLLRWEVEEKRTDERWDRLAAVIDHLRKTHR